MQYIRKDTVKSHNKICIKLKNDYLFKLSTQIMFIIYSKCINSLYFFFNNFPIKYYKDINYNKFKKIF